MKFRANPSRVAVPRTFSHINLLFQGRHGESKYQVSRERHSNVPTQQNPEICARTIGGQEPEAGRA